jgi:choline dehydrogenase-like flavoprotein
MISSGPALADEAFDYVVVGAGSAGCAVAARLAEDPRTRVALIEAGRADNSRIFQLPALFSLLQKTSYDWDFLTEPESALGRRRAYLPRGRVLGGTSSINTMVYVRGSQKDYDDWAALGCKGWSYDEVLPYFRRSENNERGADRYHGADGPVFVSDSRSVHPLLNAWVDAAGELGHPHNPDFNGPGQEGVGIYQMTQRDGLRCSASRAYLEPETDNLEIYLDAQALGVVMDGTRAVGVRVDQAGIQHTVAAEREVVICCGAYQSPQLLMLSGIGPADHLHSVGVRPVVDSPKVGENLQDHPGCYLSYISRTPVPELRDSPDDEALLRREGVGPLAWTEAGGFLSTVQDRANPDIQFHVALGMFRDEGLTPPFDSALTFGPYVNQPISRGRVTLRSSIPYAKPRILHNYVTEAKDWETLREGVRIAMRIARQSALGAHLEDVSRSVAAGLVPGSDRDADIDEYLRSHVMSFYHPAGTCGMGTVVDNELRVLGADALRIADTSIMPRLVSGNTNAPAMMIGERAADLIRGRKPAGSSVHGQH